MGLAAGVGMAVLRAARARRAPQPAAAPPTWPPLPTAASHQPPRAGTSVGSAPLPSADARLAGHGTPALVAEAAVLEAAGVTEAAEVDQAAVRATSAGGGGTAPAVGDHALAGEAPWAADLLDDLETAGDGGRPAATTGPAADDLEAIVLAEEAALEAERLEAERLELARLERDRLAAEEDRGAREQRERERDEALARFAAQREEAQALLAIQEEREANAADGASESDERQPLAVTHLPAGAGDEEAEAVEDLWPQEVRDLEPAVVLVEDEESAEPTLEPLVPDEAVADLDEEPAWGIAVGPTTAPALVPPAAADIDAVDLEADVDEGGDLRPTPLDEVDEVDEVDEDTGRPLMAGDLDSRLGDGQGVEPGEDGAEEDDEPAWASPPAPTGAGAQEHEDVWPLEPGPDAVVADEVDDEADEEPDAVGGEAVAAAADAPPIDAPAAASVRRPILTSDFDDALPADLLDDEDDDQGGVRGTAGRQRRPGQPRVPLKARRIGDDGEGGDGVPAGPAEPAGAAAAPPRTAPAAKATKATKAAKAAKAVKVTKVGAPSAKAPTTKKAAPAAKKVVKDASPSKTVSKKKATSKKAAPAEAPAPKRIASRRKKVDVVWVEPVGGTCPNGYPVKASLSSGIFHVVGGLFYERTRPDRCYRDPAAATADGLRQAKR